jgi:hypothetical protein
VDQNRAIALPLGVFNTNGGIGGLEGIFDQTLAAYVDLAG